MALFSVRDLTFAYPGAGRHALEHVSVDVERGEYLCVCGRSGCGKTTLLRQLKSVLSPHGDRSGTVLLDGVPLDEVDLATQARRIGFVMQDPDAQIVTDRVFSELSFGLESLGCESSVLRLRVAEMASYFGMQGWLYRDVAELSGGQKQLLNLASVMAMQPDVLVLDEPTSQLDPIATGDFLNTVRRINLELGCTVIITEHRLEDVFAHADRVLVLDDGQVATHGTPREVARALYAGQSPMTLALPSPVRVFYGVEGMDAGVDGRDAGVEPSACPLTVREGRTWLVERVLADPPARVSIPDEPAPDPEGEPVVELRDLWFRYERTTPDVLRDASLRVGRGVIFALVGGNGTGKSTLLKCICGAVRPYRGKLRVLGRPIASWKGNELFRGGVAMLPQDPVNLFSRKTVREELAEMLDGTRLDGDGRDGHMGRVARECGIDALLDAHPLDLSGGEQQRVALAKVLLTEPQLLLLDEPTKGLDAFFKHQLAGLLRGLAGRGVTVILVSHDVEFCARHADLAGLLFDGGVVTTATPRRLFSDSSFYTTAANRMSRAVFAGAITDEDVISLCES